MYCKTNVVVLSARGSRGLGQNPRDARAPSRGERRRARPHTPARATPRAHPPALAPAPDLAARPRRPTRRSALDLATFSSPRERDTARSAETALSARAARARARSLPTRARALARHTARALARARHILSPPPHPSPPRSYRDIRLSSFGAARARARPALALALVSARHLPSPQRARPPLPAPRAPRPHIARALFEALVRADARVPRETTLSSRRAPHRPRARVTSRRRRPLAGPRPFRRHGRARRARSETKRARQYPLDEHDSLRAPRPTFALADCAAHRADGSRDPTPRARGRRQARAPR